jgi:hypothetical protein
MATRRSSARWPALAFVGVTAFAAASGQTLEWAASGDLPRVDHLGWSAAFVADVDGDGVADLLAGSKPLATPGRAALYSGTTGAPLHEWIGGPPEEGFGTVVAAAGDSDGDGVSDVIVGAPTYGGGAANGGAAFVYSGASGTLLLTIVGANANGLLGSSAAAVGDLNGDGRSDFVLGSPGIDTALVISGADGSTLLALAASTSQANFGSSVDGAGDLDQDGVGDVLVGAPDDSNGTGAGSLFAFSGASGALLFTTYGPLSPPGFGLVVRRGDDVDGDGIPDPLVSNPDAFFGVWPPTGEVYVVSGANGSILRSVQGVKQQGFYFGVSMSGAGDQDGDGVGDFVVGGRDATGELFVYSGATGGWIKTFADPDLSFAADATFDVTGDGVNDLLIGTQNPPPWNSESYGAGRVAVRSGADGATVVEIYGVGQRQQLGNAVAILWDFDGDGTRDVAAGSAPQDGLGYAAILSGTDGSELARFSSGVGGDRYGLALTPVGDLDGDGVPELAIGAPGGGFPPVAIPGSVEVRSGAGGALLRTITGVTNLDQYGFTLASARDASGDVVLMVGAPRVTFGGVPGAGSAELLDLTTGTTRFAVGGTQNGDSLGSSIAAVGDVNGDGFVDWVVGTPYRIWNPILRTGIAMLVSGQDGTILFTWNAPKDALHFAMSVAGPGDLDGDGVPDVLVGTPDAMIAGFTRGRVDAWSGATGAKLFTIFPTALAGSFGRTLASVGDLDGDGTGDFAVSAPMQDTANARFTGAVYLYSGRGAVPLDRIDGGNSYGEFGLGLAGAAFGFDGHVNGDAIQDLVVGAPYDTSATPGIERGRVELRALDDFYLQADPLAPASGATLTLDLRRGPAGNLVALFAVAFDATPLNQFVFIGLLDAAGNLEMSGATPPGLTGHTLTLRGYAIGFSGKVVGSQDVTIAFQ